MKRITNAPTGKTLTSDNSATPDPLDARSRYRVVSANDSSVGGIGFDDLGQPRWTWITEIDGATTDQDDTFDYLKALDNDTLAIEDGAGAGEDKTSSGSGYNPYDTARIKVAGRFRR